MFIRVKRSVQPSGTYEYLQIVESVRDGARVRQRVIGNLGRRDQIVADGTLDGLLRSLAKFSERLRVVERVREESAPTQSTAIRPEVRAVDGRAASPYGITGTWQSTHPAMPAARDSAPQSDRWLKALTERRP